MKGPDEEKISAILDRTGYSLDVTTGIQTLSYLYHSCKKYGHLKAYSPNFAPMVSDDMKMPFKCPILGYTENQFAPFYDLYTTIIIMSLA